MVLGFAAWFFYIAVNPPAACGELSRGCGFSASAACSQLAVFCLVDSSQRKNEIWKGMISTRRWPESAIQ